jgi:hypothetical protein
LRKLWKCIPIFVFSVSIFFVFPLGHASSQLDTSSAIEVAKIQFINAYRSVQQAEQTGANVTDLTAMLNDVGLLLSEADQAYSIGDFDASHSLAVQCQGLLVDFANKVDVLKEAATQQSANDFWLKIVYPIFGSLAVIVAGFAIWYGLKKKYGTSGEIKHNLQNYRIVFIVAILLSALFVASPAIQTVLVYPPAQSASFSELWLLGPEKKAENYPSTISPEENYTVYLGVANQLGSCAYYRVDVKLCNTTQQLPSSFNHTASTQQSLYSLNLIVPDKGSLEMPVSFSFNYTLDENLAKVAFVDLTLNDLSSNLQGYTVTWAPQTAFSVNLIFELWIYNSTTNAFQYHDRYVSLQLNMAEVA